MSRTFLYLIILFIVIVCRSEEMSENFTNYRNRGFNNSFGVNGFKCKHLWIVLEISRSCLVEIEV